MPQFINTNLSSLNAQRNLNSSQSALATSLQRLSSGLRLNSAKDDAAGIAIAERFTAQIRGGNQAARNANDAISLAQTAEGDLNQIGNNLQRIRELAVQSANATNSATDRAALQLEASQLIAEIDRVARDSKFNGVKLLDGSFTSQQFQIGADAGQTIAISSIASARTTALGASYTASVTGTAVTGALTASSITINGSAVAASTADGVSTVNATASAKAIAAAINASSIADVTAVANATTATGLAPTASTAVLSNDLIINGVNIGAVSAGATAALQGANVAAAINLQSAATGVSATANATTGVISLSAADGRNITVTATANGLTGTGFAAATTTTAGTVTLTAASPSGTAITVAGAGVALAGLTAATTAATQTGVAVSGLNLSSVPGANSAITSLDAALASINTARAALGAYQNRFVSVVASLETTTENLSASRSRIQDADFAAETASLTRNQVLQQAGVAILAQANALPNGVLALLRG